MIINAPKEKIGSKKNPTPWIMSKNARVLIVDYMDTNLIILKAILVKIGFTENFIDSAKNGKIGLAMVQNVSQSGEHNDYDLIITGYQMPIMDGIDLVKKLREIEDSKASKKEVERLPIIMNSSDDGERSLIEFFRAGTSAFFPKPYNIDNIKNLLKLFFIIPD